MYNFAVRVEADIILFAENPKTIIDNKFGSVVSCHHLAEWKRSPSRILTGEVLAVNI